MAKAKFKTNKTFDDTKGGAGNKAPRVDELTDLLKLPANEWITMRFVGPTVSYGIHWIKTKNKEGKETSFPAVCLSYDSETEETDSTRECPWCDAESELIRFGPEYYSNAIIRSLQEDEPSKKSKHTEEEKESGFKKKGSKSWTPVRAVRLTRTLVRELKKLGALNRVKDKKTGETKAYPLSHPKYGCDINIMFDPNEKTPAKKYMVQKGERTPLSDEEQEYLMQPIEDLQKPLKLKEANSEFERWAEKMDVGSKKNKKKGKGKEEDEEDDDEEDDDEDDAPKSKGKKGAGKKPSKSDDDDEDEDDDSDDDEDDEDEKPKKGSKSKSKSKDEDDDEDDDDEDEDDEPKSKKKSASKKKSKSDDDEDDEDDDDEDDEEEEKSSKKSKAKSKKKSDDDEDDDDLDDDDEDDEPKSKKGGKKKSKDEDDEDDDLDDDDEDEDEKPAKGKKGGKAAKGKSKKDDDDEDEDDDDDLDDDDEDDEPKKGKGKDKKKSKPSKKGKKAKDEDDDDDLDDDEDD